MQKINLRELYPDVYKTDVFVDVAEEVVAAIRGQEQDDIPTVEQMHTTLKKYNTAFTATTAENKKLKKKTEQLAQSLDKATKESTLKKLADAKLHRDYEDAVAVLDRIPKEVLAAYTHRTEKERETAYGR